jgi:hypothetical protein
MRGTSAVRDVVEACAAAEVPIRAGRRDRRHGGVGCGRSAWRPNVQTTTGRRDEFAVAVSLWERWPVCYPDDSDGNGSDQLLLDVGSRLGDAALTPPTTAQIAGVCPVRLTQVSTLGNGSPAGMSTLDTYYSGEPVGLSAGGGKGRLGSSSQLTASMVRGGG